MKILLSMLISIVAVQSFASDKIIVTEVAVETPLRTGLEGVAILPTGKPLIEQIFTHKKAKYILDLVYEKNKDVVHQNIELGGLFNQNGIARINCAEEESLFPSSSPVAIEEVYCSFKAEKSFGWYADIDLGFRVTGYLAKSLIPEGTMLAENYYVVR